MKLRPLPFACVLAALAPAPALAAPHWSAPVDVVPATSDPLMSNSAPQAFVAGGRSVVVAGGGDRAVAVRGNAANVFDAPIIAATTPDGAAVGTDAAVGDDGTVAIAWASRGSGHVSIVTPSGAVLPQADLPGSGVNAIGVGIGSDGSTIVAYRTKESGSAYSLRVAVAGAGASTFGEPVTIESGAATDAIDVATGPGGAVAVAYRKLVGKYRARVAIRPAGASAFGPGEAFTALSELDDYDPRVAFDADGTVVAAWGNPAGAQYALRAPAAGAFAPATTLTSSAAFSVDLKSTPAGGAAVAVAGGGTTLAAQQAAPGGAFGAPVAVGPAYSSQFTGRAAVTASPTGTVSVVVANPVDGAVRAVDVNGADQVIGYGAKDAETPVEIASSGDRTVAVWRNVAGAISVATRSESARAAAPGDLGPRPVGRDTKRPTVRYVSGTKRFVVTSKTRSLKFKVRCSEACRYLLTGSLRTQLSAKSRRSIAPLPAVQTKTPRAGTQTVTVRLGGLAQKDLRRALKRKRGGQLFLVLEASDAASNTARARIQLTLKPAAKRTHR